MATALDVLGERWTLLVIRELLLGPKRFSELERRLSGIGPNRLSSRLRTLLSIDVATKNDNGAYALTPFGEGLRAPVLGLATWGLGLTAGQLPDEPRADMVALCIASLARPERLADTTARAEITCADEPFTVAIAGGRMLARSGPVTDGAAATLACSGTTFVELALGRRDLASALDSGAATSQGDPAELATVIDALVTAVRDARDAARARA